MRIGIAPNPAKERAHAHAEEAIAVLCAVGCETLRIEGLYEEGPARRRALEKISACDVLVAVGGDGTVICAAKLVAELNKPLLGINAGKLGFTTDVEPEDIPLLSQLAKYRWREEHRMMLQVVLESEGESRGFLALNDAVVSGELAKIVEYRMAFGQNYGFHRLFPFSRRPGSRANLGLHGLHSHLPPLFI